MRERTNDVLLEYFEQTLSDGLTLQELLQAAAGAFAKLLDANAVYFFTEKGTWLQPAELAGGTPPRPVELAKEEYAPARTTKERMSGRHAAPPGPELIQKIETCMAKKAGRSVCVCEKDAAGMAWWLFWLEEDAAVRGAAVCAVPAVPDAEALSGAHRLARNIAPRFAVLAKNQGERTLSALSENAVALLSHEIKTPLTVALSSLQLLRRMLECADVPEKTKKYFNYVELNLYKALRIAMNLVEAQYAQPGSRFVKPEYIVLARMLAKLVDSAQPYAEITAVRLIFENRTDEACGLMCDVFYLERILLNLLSNALKHAPPDSSVRVVLEQKGDALLIHVEDEGTGIPKEVRGRLFEKFWRGPNERTGTGLGLYLSRRFAGEMGGTLCAENLPQGGARFTLSLPRSADRGVSPVIRSTPSSDYVDSRDTLLRIEFSELLSQKCI